MADVTMPEPPAGAYVALIRDAGDLVPPLFARDDDTGVEERRWYDRHGFVLSWAGLLADASDNGRCVVRLYPGDDPAIAILGDDEPDPLPWGVRFEVDREWRVRLSLPPAAKVLDPAEAETVGLALVRAARRAASGGEPS